MLIDDRVYGKIEIIEPVLIELINSAPLKRLKGVYNSCIFYSVAPWKNFTRYEHSLGVMLFLKLKGATLKEQIAGLLHDVPHTVFSHTVDFVFNDEKFEFHEKFHHKIINESEIPNILEKHGYNVEYMLDEKNFGLLEQNIPNLCADRIDYTLREFVARDGQSKEIQAYLKHMVVDDNMFVFDDEIIAKEFSIKFLEMIKNWGSPVDLATQQIFVQLLKIGINEKIITQEDLFTTDKLVLDKLKVAKNSQIDELLKQLNPKLRVINDDIDCDYYSKEKNRYLDPIILPNKKRVSEIYPEYYLLLQTHKEFMEKGIYAKILK
jgi:uncharacterized protein